MQPSALIALLLASFAAIPALSQNASDVSSEGVGLDAWHMDYLYTLVNEQLEPIVSPNRQSSHMHRVLGGSNFAAAYNFDELRASPCPTASISVDHSSYWSPQLYWIVDPSNPSNTTFLQLRRLFLVSLADPTVPVIPFFKGFRMLAGEPNRKSANPIFVYECHRKLGLVDSILGRCQSVQGRRKPRRPSLNSIRDGGCPATHPKRLPSSEKPRNKVLLEYTYLPEASPDIIKGQNMSGHLAWANGDTTSYGQHADFLNGWDVDILGKALNDPECVNLGHSIEIQKCRTLAPYFDMAAGQACAGKPARGQLTEPFPQGDGNVISKLPGFNPLWGPTGSKPTCSPAPAGLDVSAFQSDDGPYVVPASEQANNTSVNLDRSEGWHNVACFETLNNRPLGNNTITYYDSNMTPERCQSSCGKSGFSYAGLTILGGFNCICSNTLSDQAAIAYSNCSTPCPGSSATCGGQYNQDIYYQAAQFVGQNPKAYDVGCYASSSDISSSGLVKALTYSFTSNSMTRDVCSQACVDKGAKWSALRDSTCYCGNDVSIGTGYFVPSDFCSLPCKGNNSESCGNYYNLNTFNLTNYAYTARNSSIGASAYQGCFAEGNGKLALSEYGISDNALTSEMFSLAPGMETSATATTPFKADRSFPIPSTELHALGLKLNPFTVPIKQRPLTQPDGKVVTVLR
ncbi:hypothetical protein QFC20_005011 [Naganishia adeliensis]|uniref:Uncharacterized protein n=1 Tax=Naganishia adeliensis TaxID=92952 RepID=A0ACC2VT74_9TREE|nr:hypothetical protein QFC20_005011 [Naganishia adeliensis]